MLLVTLFSANFKKAKGDGWLVDIILWVGIWHAVRVGSVYERFAGERDKVRKPLSPDTYRGHCLHLTYRLGHLAQKGSSGLTTVQEVPRVS